jgi:hypothetical protein
MRSPALQVPESFSGDCIGARRAELTAASPKVRQIPDGRRIAPQNRLPLSPNAH